jgi:hypothetical protein
MVGESKIVIYIALCANVGIDLLPAFTGKFVHAFEGIIARLTQ